MQTYIGTDEKFTRFDSIVENPILVYGRCKHDFLIGFYISLYFSSTICHKFNMDSLYPLTHSNENFFFFFYGIALGGRKRSRITASCQMKI